MAVFGKAIRRQREFLRYKQKEIAEMVGINARTQGNIERGRHWPSLTVYFKLCSTLQVAKPSFAP